MLIKENIKMADRDLSPTKEATHFLSAIIVLSIIRRSFGMLTQERLKELLGYNPKTGKFVRKISTNRNIKIGDDAGSITSEGYNCINIDGSSYYCGRLAFLYMDGYFPEYDVDHINRIRTDDRWDNLRHTTRSCNIKNCSKRADNSSGVTGVSFDKKNNKWNSAICSKAVRYHLGRYSYFEDAVCARLAAEQCLGWPGCNKNTPAYLYVKNNILQA